ncbi:MAG: hypothetical protein GY762_11775, partial [Proteobacteria bacterium]|nr:hypothetical protein [Pseudomonadota bacterium]
PTPTPTSTFPLIQAFPYLPPLNIAIIPTTPPDLSIHGIELTQAIQCFDTSNGLAGCSTNSLRLANKKDATSRIYLKYSGIWAGMSGVPVRLYIRANGVWYNGNASGRATKTIDQASDDSADIYFNVNFTNDVTVDFYAVVDPNNTISETNESNNRYPASGYITKTFRKRDTLKIIGQRLRYHPAGHTGGQYAQGWAVNGGAADLFEQLLPIRNNGINYSVKSGYLNWTKSLTPCGSGVGPDNQHDLIKTLNSMWLMENVFSWIFGTGAFTGADHVYGWVDDDGYPCGHADMPVYPHAGGYGVVAIGTDSPGSSTDNPGSGALIFVHELLHDYDLKHTDTGGDDCGSNDSSSTFPYGTSSIQEFGFNPITAKIYDPADTHDAMSYCPSGGSKEGWISPYTWEYMSNKIDGVVQAAQDEEGAIRLGAENFQMTQAERSLVVNATIYNPEAEGYNPRNPAFLYNMHLVDGGVEYPLPGDGYAVQLRRGEKVLYQEDFDISFESEYSPGAHSGQGDDPGHDDPPFPADDTKVVDLAFAIPWAEGTDNVALTHGDDVFDVQQVSENAPIVGFSEPVEPLKLPPGESLSVEWDGKDEDGDVLSYSLYYSHDDGESWALLATEMTETSYEVESDAFAGSEKGLFRVVATDGINIAFDQSAPVTIPNKAPSAIISEPSAGKSFIPGALVVMQGIGIDMEEGTLHESALTWSSDRDGLLGIGASVPRNDLSLGWHEITLETEDSQGAETKSSVRIFIGHHNYLPSLVN